MMTQSAGDKAETIEVMEHRAASKEANEHASPQVSWMENSKVFKGDDSDGRIAWNPRTIVAAVSLAGMYTASQIILYFVSGLLGLITTTVGGAEALAWIPTAYLIVLAAIAPFVGYLQDLFGRRNIGITGLVLLCLSSVLMATAQTFGQAILSMSFAGAGAAIGELTALAGISDIVPVKRRAVGVACITTGMLPWQPFVLYGQLLAEYHGWRSALWLVFTFTGIVLVGFVCSYFPKIHPRAEGHTFKTILAQLDYVGGILSISGLTLLLIALQAGGYTHPWRSAYVLIQLLLGFVLIVTFIVWESKVAKNPMVPAVLFKGQRVVALVYVVAFVAGMNFYSFLNIFPVALSAIYEPTPVKLGLYNFGFSIGVGAGVIIGDAMLSVCKGQVRIVLIVSAAIMTAFLGALAATTPDTVNLTTVLGTFGGLGCGGILTPAATVALIVVPDAYLATAAALSLSIRGVGGAIGYAIYSSIMDSKLRVKLPAYVISYAIDAGLPASEASEFVGAFLTLPASAAKLPYVTTDILQAANLGSQWAWADSLRYVWLATIPFGVLAIICAACVPSIRKWETNRIRAQM